MDSFDQLKRVLEVILVDVQEIKKGNKYIMAAIDDLNAEVAALTSSASAEIAAATAAITAAQGNNDSAAIEAAVASLKTVQSSLDAATAQFTPAPAAAPAAPSAS